jgi:hypothetical protein
LCFLFQLSCVYFFHAELYSTFGFGLPHLIAGLISR